jgi:hypothetical protein
LKRNGHPLAGRRGASPGAPLRWIVENASYDGDDCLPWPFEIGRYGYGTIKHEGKRRPASRVMCIVAHGAPPTPEHEASHSCGNGNKACMTPKHLFWDTKLDNIREAVARGVNPRGEKSHWATLTENDVLEIRRLGKTGMLQREIAALFGVHRPAVSRILNGKRWGWLK